MLVFVLFVPVEDQFFKETGPVQMFQKVGVLKNFAKFTGKKLNRGLFFSKVAKLRNFSEHLFNRAPPDDCF